MQGRCAFWGAEEQDGTCACSSGSGLTDQCFLSTSTSPSERMRNFSPAALHGQLWDERCRCAEDGGGKSAPHDGAGAAVKFCAQVFQEARAVSCSFVVHVAQVCTSHDENSATRCINFVQIVA